VEVIRETLLIGFLKTTRTKNERARTNDRASVSLQSTFHLFGASSPNESLRRTFAGDFNSVVDVSPSPSSSSWDKL